MNIPAIPTSRIEANLKRLIWAYFWLLIFEGALRKWIVPQLATLLLVIRDPVLIALCAYAYYTHRFPRSLFVGTLCVLGVLSLVAGLIALHGNYVVPLYGWRANFFHLLLMFIMAKVMNLSDVQKFGKWMLIIAIPMAVLIVLQFRSPAYSWINAGAGSGGAQISLAEGRVRPAGPFSFNIGVSLFYAITAGMILSQFLTKRFVSQKLTVVATISLLIAAAFSGSRSFLSLIVIVVSMAFVSMLLRPRLMLAGVRVAIIGAIIALVLSSLSFVQEGMDVMGKRIESAGEVEGGASGFTQRFATMFTDPLDLIVTAPLLGRGLGLGTNAGSALLSGTREFLLAETEWSRVILESGPILGLLYLMWRVWFVTWLGLKCLGCARRGHVLPFLIFGAVALNLLIGQFGQPTALGFAVFGGGLCLSAMRLPKPDGLEIGEDDNEMEPEDGLELQTYAKL